MPTDAFTKPVIIGVFPRELRASQADYPFIEFSAYVRAAGNAPAIIQSVFLPMPEGLSFGESGNYGTIDLGILAAVGGTDALNKMMTDPSVASAKSGLSAMASNIVSQVKTASSLQVMAIAGKALGVGEGALFSGKAIMSPNTNTTFTGNATRSFTFSFKMVSSVRADSAAIRDIHNFFRRYTYAGGDAQNNVILSYPPVWTIRFYQDGVENQFLPKIFSCYLTNTTSAFNSSSNIYRPDGAPIEVDITLAFQETRMLTRNDIDILAAGRQEPWGSDTAAADRGISSNFVATSTFSAAPEEAPQ